MKSSSQNNTGSFFAVDWPAPKNILAIQTSRKQGVSQESFAQFNLALHVNDKKSDVLSNRNTLAKNLGLLNEPYWLEQVHGTQVLNLDELPANKLNTGSDNRVIPIADASYASKTNKVCSIMTADCLPILLCSQSGDWVAAIHAGWRSLSQGIIQKTLAKYFGPKENLMAWLGPAISQKHFEVGVEVRQAFVHLDSRLSSAFIAKNNQKYHADLYAIASRFLADLSIEVYGGDFCTYEDEEYFYSYRRDGETGRMASLIWLNNNP